jgi:flagellar biosynthesis protein FliR
MDSSLLAPWLHGASPVVAVALLTRVAVGVEVAAPCLLPAVEMRTRLGLSLLVALAALPAAVTASPLATLTTAGTAVTAGDAVAAIVGEAAIGLGQGLAVAALASAVAWAGDILGTVSGLAWLDGGEEDAAESPAGVARLARWVSLAAFLAAGGLAAVVAGLVDGVRTMPVGLLSHGTASPMAIGTLLAGAMATAIGLAVTLAVPAMVAVMAFQLAASLCLRVAACDPGPGTLHAATALVLLATLCVGAAGWSDAAGQGLLPTLSSVLLGHRRQAVATGDLPSPGPLTGVTP